MPRGFEEEGKVLKLKSSLYGFRQSPRNFFEHLKVNLLIVVLHNQMQIHVSLSLTGLFAWYMLMTLIYSPTAPDIDEILEKLRNLKMELNLEYDVAGFLGVLIKILDKNRVKLTQTV